jgi:hypothetical protein
MMSKDTECPEVPACQFMNGEQRKIKDQVVLATYPRSGNTFMRATLEKFTSIVTGSDGNIRLKLI